MAQTPAYDSSNVKNAPEMWVSEMEYIENALVELAKQKKPLRILEWGSGNGTIYFSNFLKGKDIDFKWTAIEHFVPWHEKVIAMLDENGLSENVECLLNSPTCEEDKNVQETLDLNDYINAPLSIGMKFDFILVDGRRRAECMECASKVLSDGGITVLHDAEREWYHDGCKHYASGGQFVTANPTEAAKGGVQKLWVGRLK